MSPSLEIVDTEAIAERLGVKKGTVHQWRFRHDDFPAPDGNLSTGPIWRWSTVKTWASKNGRL